jgi:Hydrogenase maturation factor
MGIFINTSGIGIIEHNLTINPLSVQAGDAVIINGDLGRHGIAIMDGAGRIRNLETT